MIRYGAIYKRIKGDTYKYQGHIHHGDSGIPFLIICGNKPWTKTMAIPPYDSCPPFILATESLTEYLTEYVKPNVYEIMWIRKQLET